MKYKIVLFFSIIFLLNSCKKDENLASFIANNQKIEDSNENLNIKRIIVNIFIHFHFKVLTPQILAKIEQIPPTYLMNNVFGFLRGVPVDFASSLPSPWGDSPHLPGLH